jgi:hypothetical protein
MRIEPLIFALLLTCSLSAQAGDAEERVPSSCPVTRPPDPAFEPPAPYNEKQTGRFWYGSKDLWTVLANDGIWRGIKSARGTRNKFWWWREGWKSDTDLRANDVGLVINAHRIDGVAPPVGPLRVTNALLSTGWAMLTMLEITSGCWEITGNYRADYLTMVVWVPNGPLDETR